MKIGIIGSKGFIGLTIFVTGKFKPVQQTPMEGGDMLLVGERVDG